MWEFLNKLLAFLTRGINMKLDKILAAQQSIKELIMGDVLSTIQSEANELATLKTQLADGLANVRQDIANLKDKLANATTPEQVEEIMRPALTSLKEVADALTATAAETPDEPGTTEPPEGELSTGSNTEEKQPEL